MGCSTSLVLPSGEPSYDNIAFRQTTMKNLDRYFYLLHKKIRIENTDETVHLKECVEKCVRSLMQQVTKNFPRLSVEDSQTLKIGSMYDGTKVGRADQFDYIVVLSELERSEILIEDLNQTVNGTDVKLCIPPNEYIGDKRSDYKDFQDSWADVTDNFYLKGMKTAKNKRIGLLDIFEKCVRKVSVLIPPFKTNLGTLLLDSTARIYKEGPTVRLTLKWTKWWFEIEESRRIDKTSTEIVIVNITPAIRVKEIADFMSVNDPLNTTIFDKILKKGFFLVIPNTNGHFKKVFTNIEAILIKELPDRHIKVVRVLKFLIDGDDRVSQANVFKNVHFRLFDSFAIKMLVLANSNTCPCMTHSDFELFDCVNHVLQKMFRNLYDVTDKGFVICPNIFICSDPLITNNIDIVKLNRYHLSELIKHDLKVWIGEREKYELRSNSMTFGVVPLNTKILNNLRALNPD